MGLGQGQDFLGLGLDIKEGQTRPFSDLTRWAGPYNEQEALIRGQGNAMLVGVGG